MASFEAPVAATKATRIWAGAGVPRVSSGRTDSTRELPLEPSRPTLYGVGALTGMEAPSVPALQTWRETEVTVEPVDELSTVVIRTCSTPAKEPQERATLHPVEALLSVSSKTRNSVVAAKLLTGTKAQRKTNSRRLLERFMYGPLTPVVKS